MIIRRFTAIVLGILLQVALFGVVPAATPPAPCPIQTSSCCGDTGTCPCMDAGGDEKPSLPAIPVEQERLTPLITPADPEIPGIETRAGPTAASPALSAVETLNGHRGVPLAVSFCRFTI